jgi:hypothetical protein
VPDDVGEPVGRNEELSTREKIKEELLKTYIGIDKAFEAAADRINDNLDYWDIYNCELGTHQYYTGISRVFVPIVKDAIDARATRFVNQVFPQSGHYVECITDQDEQPEARLALLGHYIETAKLRENVLPAVFRNGDIEGQWNIYVGWQERTKHVTTKVQKGPDLGDGLQLDADDVGDDDRIEDVKEEKVLEFGPCVEVLSDNDVMIYPAVSDSVDDALYNRGGAVTILRRWSDAMIKQKIADGEIEEEPGEHLIEAMKSRGSGPGNNTTRRDTLKDHADAAGIKSGGAGKYALVYETWKVLKVDDEMRLTRTYFGSDKLILSCRLNPFWCDLCPLLSVPVAKVAGMAKGISKVKAVATMQYQANDFLNQGADSATMGLNPISAVDPLACPKMESLVIAQGAVWPIAPGGIKFLEFPRLWENAEALVEGLSRRIMQTLSVNPSMLTQRSGSKKLTQGEIMAEQQIDMLSTADVIIPFEAGILTPLIQRFDAYDAQYRQEGIWVRAFGKNGMKSAMQEVPPQQVGYRVWYKWLGVEQARTSQQMQQQISFINVLRTIPPEMMPGRKLDIVPVVENACLSVFGPNVAPRVFKPLSDLVGMPPEEENQLLAAGIDLPVEPNDNDAQHMQVHAQLPPSRVRDGHIAKHQMQMSAKNQAAAAQQQAAQGGKPGGGGPQAGAMQKGPHGGKGPPGALRPAQMAGGMAGPQAA